MFNILFGKSNDQPAKDKTNSITENGDHTARVIYDYVTNKDNELTIQNGEIITLIGEVTPENWILAKNKDGKQGYVPDKYFQIISNHPAQQNKEDNKQKELLQEIVEQNRKIRQLKESNIRLEKENIKLKEEKSEYQVVISKITKEENQMSVEMERMRQELDALQDEKKEYEITINELKNELKKVKASDINKFKQWDSNDLLNWIFSIENEMFLNKYEDKLTKEIFNGQVTGNDLITITVEDIKNLGVSKFADRKLLKSNIERLLEINAMCDEGGNQITDHDQETAFI